MTFIYGPPYTEEKQGFWGSLSSLRGNNSKKWCVIGDSNIVAKPEEKLGGAPFDAAQAKWSEDDAILEKLDRILVSLEWKSSFPKAMGVLDATISSDHAPIVLFLEGMKKKYKRDFKFEAKWLLEEEYTKKVEESWSPGCSGHNTSWFGRKLSRTRIKLRQWSKLKRGQVKGKEEEMKERIRTLQGNS
ncbi:hypothetical protein V6N12_062315 [Hibiscus sabdariffa]|uniref:Uncharacterized protein n=1 Tax=Hibiscus sabdariffa TaxID=183260 RepID=A0ABR2F8H8_9ROSI